MWSGGWWVAVLLGAEGQGLGRGADRGTCVASDAGGVDSLISHRGNRVLQSVTVFSAVIMKLPSSLAVSACAR